MSRFAMRIKEFIIDQRSKVCELKTFFVSSRLVRQRLYTDIRKNRVIFVPPLVFDQWPVDWPCVSFGGIFMDFQPWNFFGSPELKHADPSRRLLDGMPISLGKRGKTAPSNDAGGFFNPCGRGRYPHLAGGRYRVPQLDSHFMFECSNQDFSMKVFERCAIDKWYNYTWRIIPVQWLETRGKTPLKPFGRGTTLLRDILAIWVLTTYKCWDDPPSRSENHKQKPTHFTKKCGNCTEDTHYDPT